LPAAEVLKHRFCHPNHETHAELRVQAFVESLAISAGETMSLQMEDVTMRRFDFSPLYRQTIGFDHLANLIEQLASSEGDNGFPPYNIERLGENEYRITMAVAGFAGNDLNIEVKEGTLSVRGEKSAESAEKAYLHRGIAARNFERRFRLADYVEVSGASLENGLLHVDLKREIPEAMKPRTIKIGDASKNGTARIEGEKQKVAVSA
jgi:molecular chaperone IbpA